MDAADELPHRFGPRPAAARLTVILVHGRGASSSDILGVAHEIGLPDVAYLVPDAPGRTWYPLSFLAPFDQNEPHLTRSLALLDRIVDGLAREGVRHDRVAFLGFSQGACLSLEYAARHARRYAAVVAFSGGLIGPPGTPREYAGSFAGTPVFLGCSDVDAHIPLDRVHESATVLRVLGARVDERIYPGMGHAINAEEIEAARELFRGE